MVSTVILCGMSFFPSKSATGEVNSELKNLTSQISQFVSFLKVEEDEDKSASPASRAARESSEPKPRQTETDLEAESESKIRPGSLPLEPKQEVSSLEEKSVHRRPTTLDLGPTHQPLVEPPAPQPTGSRPKSKHGALVFPPLSNCPALSHLPS